MKHYKHLWWTEDVPMEDGIQEERKEQEVDNITEKELNKVDKVTKRWERPKRKYRYY